MSSPPSVPIVAYVESVQNAGRGNSRVVNELRAPEDRAINKLAATVLGASLALTLAGTIWTLAPLFDPKRVRPRGDGRTAASYGFDLTTTLVPKAKIVASGMVADGLAALTDPKTIAAPGRGSYLVPTDTVIGVVAGGVSRAYPLRVLVWHEIVNDTVGGVPIVVTYHPLSGGIAVFDRRLAGRTPVFGVSGLLYQSSLLMYDRAEGRAGESLWSQLQARAVSGPAAEAGLRLELYPFALARFGDWERDHPETTVPAPVRGEESKYGQDVYGTYLNSSELRFPVDPVPPAGSLGLKRRVFVTGSPGAWTVTPLPPEGGDARFAAVSPRGTTPAAGFYAFWFAWYATHSDEAL
jgi:hypothetical protein